MTENKIKKADRLGCFEVFEISEPTFLDSSKGKDRKFALIGLDLEERRFLESSLMRGRYALIILKGRDGALRIVLPALYSMFRILLVFSPSTPTSTADLYTVLELHGTVAASPRALQLMKSSSDLVDYSDRINRLLNINCFLALGTERKRCYHDMIDNSSAFALNLAHLFGLDLTLDMEYPEPIFPARFDYALLGAIFVSAFSRAAKSDACTAHLRFLSHNGTVPFADIRLPGEPEEYLSAVTDVICRLNMPLKLESREHGCTRILFSPIRPELSVFRIKQTLTIKGSIDYKMPDGDGDFPK